jgi:DNA-binding transcriptional ArsR family regulator
MPTHPSRSHIVERAEQIALLASPARIEIVDTLESLGGAVTVAELAGALGRRADALYYHLRQLVEGGLIEEQGGPDGSTYRLRAPPGRRLALRYAPGKSASARAMRRVAASIARVSERDFARALADPGTSVSGAHRELWAARAKGWVAREELGEINALLKRLLDLLQKPRDRGQDRLIALSFSLAPLDPKPPRRKARVKI